LNGFARSATGARSWAAGGGSETICSSKSSKPVTRKSISWKPWPPPNMKRALPSSSKTSVRLPPSGIEMETPALSTSASTTPFGWTVKRTEPRIVKMPAALIRSWSFGFVDGMPCGVKPASNCST
jgi:hypothetical protein